jgi:prepilin peptidase CpaA
MDSVLINHLSIALLCALLLVAALQDLSDYRIPNIIIISLVVLYPVYVLSAPVEVLWGWSLGIAAVFFLIGLALFSAGIMGGGDVKLITVTSLWMGVTSLVPFIWVMSITGGIMSLFMLSSLRATTAFFCGQFGLISVQEKIMTDKLAYGVAIAAGGLFGAYQLLVLG